MSDNKLAMIQSELAEWVSGERSWCDEHHGLPNEIELTARADLATIRLLSAKRDILSAQEAATFKPGPFTDAEMSHPAMTATFAQEAATEGEAWTDPAPWLYRSGTRTAHKMPYTHVAHCPRDRAQYDAEQEADDE